VANQYGKTVTFMPQAIYGDNGSGMHTHQSLWKGGKPLFAGDAMPAYRRCALVYRRVDKAGPALAAIIRTDHHYKRLVPGSKRQ